MAKFIKELSNSVAGVATALTSATQGLSSVVTSVSTSTVNLVDGMGTSTGNLIKVSNNYTEEFVLDSSYSLEKTKLVNSAKTNALQAVLKDETVIAKLQDAETQVLLQDIFEDYDLEA